MDQLIIVALVLAAALLEALVRWARRRTQPPPDESAQEIPEEPWQELPEEQPERRPGRVWVDDDPAVAERERLAERESEAREATAAEPVVQEPVTREPVAWEPATREPVLREPLGREPAARETTIRRPRVVVVPPVSVSGRPPALEELMVRRPAAPAGRPPMRGRPRMRHWVSGPAGARRGIVIMTILGPCRGLE